MTGLCSRIPGALLLLWMLIHYEVRLPVLDTHGCWMALLVLLNILLQALNLLLEFPVLLRETVYLLLISGIFCKK